MDSAGWLTCSMYPLRRRNLPQGPVRKLLMGHGSVVAWGCLDRLSTRTDATRDMLTKYRLDV